LTELEGPCNSPCGSAIKTEKALLGLFWLGRWKTLGKRSGVGILGMEEIEIDRDSEKSGHSLRLKPKEQLQNRPVGITIQKSAWLFL